MTNVFAQTPKVVTGTSTSSFNLQSNTSANGYTVTGNLTSTVVNFSASTTLATGNAVFDNSSASAFTLNNLGSIQVTGVSGNAVNLTSVSTLSPSIVNNQGTIRGATTGVAVANSQGIVNNTNSILATGANGITLSRGGSVVNGSLDGGGTTVTGATITGASSGILFNGLGGSVTNYAGNSITGQGTTTAGVSFTVGGSGVVDNRGTITGSGNGIRLDSGTTGNITNSGIIQSTVSSGQGHGIFFNSNTSGTVTNLAGGSIIGTASNGIFFAINSTVTSPIRNAGSISGIANGIFLTPGGQVVNGSVDGGVTTVAGASITGGTGVQLSGTGGSVINYAGSITGNGATNAGVYISAGTGAVDNRGTISGVGSGVRFESAVAGSVINSGTIQGTSLVANQGNGIFFNSNSSGSITNLAGGSISSQTSNGILFAANSTVSSPISNAGSITGAVNGIVLTPGGQVINGSTDGGGTTVASASITGGSNGVQLSGAGGAVTNYAGTITGNGATNAGVYIAAGSGTVDNRGLISGVGSGVRFETGTTGSVVNRGAIQGTSLVANQGNGVLFNTNSGGSVTNLAGGSIAGTSNSGIFYAANTTVTAPIGNAGSISGGVNGITLTPGGQVFNGSVDGGTSTVTGASITGGSNGIQLSGTGGSVTNYVGNSIAGNGAAGAGVSIVAGTGTVDNKGGITGGSNGVRFDANVTGSVTNSGTITGTSTAANVGNGVFFVDSSGSVTNNAGGSIVGAGSSGIFVMGTTSAVAGGAQINNAGSVTGFQNGVQLGLVSGGVPVGDGGVVTNTGTISGTNNNGVFVASGAGSVTNAAGASISGGNGNGVQFGVLAAAGTVVNDGTISGTNDGVVLQNGGSVTNGATGLIQNTAAGLGNRDGITVENASGTVVNSGQILSVAGSGLFLSAGGSLNNNGAASLIRGAINGVQVRSGGTVTHNSGAIIGAAGDGVEATGGVTVQSASLIQGGVNAVRFISGNNFLTLKSGSMTIGNVRMGIDSDQTTVQNGADIAQVPTFDGGTGSSRLIFDNYQGPVAGNIQSWVLTQLTNSSDVTLTSGKTYQSSQFLIDSGSRLAFSGNTGDLTGDVLNNGLMDFRNGDGSGAYAIHSTLTNGGVINLASSTGAPGNTLTVSNYVGTGGAIKMNTYLGTDGSPSDRLVIDGGTGSGNTSLLIANAGGGGALTMGDGILVVDARNSATTSPGAFALGGRAAAGAYEYLLYRGSASNAESWYLRSVLLDPLTPPTPTPNPDVLLPGYRVEVPLDSAIPGLAGRLGYATLGTYHDRLGEDYADTLSDGRKSEERRKAGWVRLFAEDGRVGDSSSTLSRKSLDKFHDEGPAYDFNLQGLQAGVDIYRNEDEDRLRDIAGLYFTVSHLDSDVKAVYGGKAGSVSMTGYSLGGYWTRKGETGWYVDGVVQGTYFDDIHTHSVLDQKLKTSGWGFTASVEGGYPIALRPTWTLEPQAQLIYQRLDIDGDSDDFGRVRYDNSDSFLGRLGARLVKNWTGDDGRNSTGWLRANLWRNFNPELSTTFSGLQGNNPVKLDSSLGKSWAQIGLGFSGQARRNVYAFASLDYNWALDGDKGHSTSGRAGVRVVW